MMIPFKVKTFSFLLACACSTAGMAQVGNDSPVKQVKISGYVGTRITDCIEHRVKAQDVDIWSNRSATRTRSRAGKASSGGNGYRVRSPPIVITGTPNCTRS